MKLRIKQRIDGPIVPLGDDFVVNLERARALREVRREPQGRQGRRSSLPAATGADGADAGARGSGARSGTS